MKGGQGVSDGSEVGLSIKREAEKRANGSLLMWGYLRARAWRRVSHTLRGVPWTTLLLL